MANPCGATSTDPAKWEQFQKLAKEHIKSDGTINIAAISGIMNVPRQTIQGWRHKLAAEEKHQAIQMPAFLASDEDEPIADILDRKRKHFERKHAANAARQWFEIKVKENKPYGVLLWGDPHLDDDGCNIPLIERHLTVARQPGIYSVNIGDTSNNWVGRLERLYAHQETSRNTGRRLVDWFMWDSGATWLCWVAGNHDAWNEGVDFLTRLAKKKIPVIDWRAQFRLSHPDGSDVKVDASHGRKGSSIWNNLHATLRAAKLGEAADLYATGHTHNYGLEHLEIAEQGRSCWLVQLRGYKFMDSHALHNNFAESQMGSSVLAVINPGSRTRIQCFEDVEQAAEYLAWLRRSA
ncbi:MAG: hypothetical protein KF810_16755 [Rhizobiaceae bacterium]|nr:hypothetical protein [Rhizobiaceae bacterium]